MASHKIMMCAMTYANFHNLTYLEELYQKYTTDKKSIDSSWCHFFEGMEFGEGDAEHVILKEVSREIRIVKLIDAYRTYGHLQASFNPLTTDNQERVKELSLEFLGFHNEELEDQFPTVGILQHAEAPLKEIIHVLERTYCGMIGIEYMGFQSPELEAWLQERIEPSQFQPQLSLDEKKRILDSLNRSELFEIFLHTKYVGQKRFSVEGGETLIPILQELLESGSEVGMKSCVIGMSHRGRLNVLANILKKSFSMIFSEFEDYYDPVLQEGTGDVKYHRGFSSTIRTAKGKEVHVSLAANPSHLESVDPVVEGSVYAKQILCGDHEKKEVIPFLLHGDASISGQGVVYECMQLYRLEGYSTGGTIHIIFNNQIGFTTLPKDSRSTRYCTDIARTFSAPVFHVNAEDPEGCVWAAKLAMHIRQRFHCDVFIDMNCYRKYGHNEGDEPAFTQPLEYQLIRKKRSIREIFRDQLITKGVLEQKLAERFEEEFRTELHRELEEWKLKKEISIPEAFEGVWKGFHRGDIQDLFAQVNTATSKEILREITGLFTTIPHDFHVHTKIDRLLKERQKMIQEEKKPSIDWSLAEHLAFGTLLWEGRSVRLAGQDTRRGTFSQRHALLVDQKTNTNYYPLKNLKESQGRFDIFDSSLSEFAALGFEFGYSLSNPAALVIWEAQFGDFVNGGQVVIDQYISSSEQKWLRFSGLVLLLPHGYEGQGPEHSSGRMERFLQLAGSANIQIVNPTTPSQYFHLLRRQVLRSIRKPLIVFTPKGLLRHPKCVSTIHELATNTFEEMIDDDQGIATARRVILCTGRIYYDLSARREALKKEGVVILRLEQLYPFHTEKFKKILQKYQKAQEFFWVQEEPRNMGAWNYLFPLFLDLLPKEAALRYVGRQRSASTAAGSHAVHEKEQQQLLDHAFSNL